MLPQVLLFMSTRTIIVFFFCINNAKYILMDRVIIFLDPVGILTAEMEPGLRVTGHRVSDFGRVGSGHGSVCQTRCLTRFLNFNMLYFDR